MSRILPAGVPAGTPDRDFEQEPDQSGEITNAERATNAPLLKPRDPEPRAASKRKTAKRIKRVVVITALSVLGLVFAYPSCGW